MLDYVFETDPYAPNLAPRALTCPFGVLHPAVGSVFRGTPLFDQRREFERRSFGYDCPKSRRSLREAALHKHTRTDEYTADEYVCANQDTERPDEHVDVYAFCHPYFVPDLDTLSDADAYFDADSNIHFNRLAHADRYINLDVNIDTDADEYAHLNADVDGLSDRRDEFHPFPDAD